MISREQSPQRAARVLLVLQCGVALYAIATAFSASWTARWVQDDAYVSFRYAHNLVRGAGLVYNPGQRVEGYSNFLWTMLSAVPLALGHDDPLPFMHVAGAVLWWGCYALLLAFSIRLWRRGVWAAPLAIVAVAQHWSFNMWFLSGMETPLVAFLLTLMLFCFSFDPRKHPTSLLFASLAGVLLTMTRADGMIAMAGIAVAGLIVHRKHIVDRRLWRVYLLAPALPLLLLWLPYTTWRISYYGSFFPNTYYAKVAYLPYYARGWEYLAKYVSVYGLAPFLAFVAAGAVAAFGGMQRRFLFSAAAVLSLLAFYVVRLGGDFMEWRFVVPQTGLLYLAIVSGASLVAMRLAARLRPATAAASADGASRDRIWGWMGGAFVALWLAWTTGTAMPDYGTSIVPGQELIGSLRRYGDRGGFNWHAVGNLFDDVLPPNVTIATTSAGIIPFFCDRPCLDLHGLTDSEIARAPVPVDQRGRMGHEHWLEDRHQIRARGVDILLQWADPSPYPRALVTPMQEGFETVSVQLPDGRYVDFLILNPGAIDRESLARDPRVVFFGQSAVADKTEFHSVAAAFADHIVIDRLNLEDPDSERIHSYEEFYPPDRPEMHIYHTKFLRYAPPLQDTMFEDSGRRIYLAARWKFHGVDPGRDLIIVGRHDHTGAARYDIEINGRAVAATLETSGAPEELWGEVWARVDHSFLKAGANDIRITRSSPGGSDAEWYHFWALQPRAHRSPLP